MRLARAAAGTCERARVMGTLLLAREGISGTIAGPPEGIAAVLDHLKAIRACRSGHKESRQEMPFLRMKVRLKKKIVTMGAPEADPTAQVGTYVDPMIGTRSSLIRTWW